MPSEHITTEPLDSKPKKVAIVHDILFNYGGAERVLDELIRIYPNADVYTFFLNFKDKVILNKYKRKVKNFSFFSYFNFSSSIKIFSILKIVSWLYFINLNLNKYDLVISSCHSFNSKIVRKNKDAIHLCYIHTPPRYLYGRESEYSNLLNGKFKNLFSLVFFCLRKIDQYATSKPDILISNSKHIQSLIRETYNRDSTVIYPPVSLQAEPLQKVQLKKKYFLCHSRLVSQKGVRLAIETCTKYNLPLKVIGEGYLLESLKNLSGKTITFLGRVEDEYLKKIYTGAIALLYPAIDDDFGIVPIESMAMGIPVIAFFSGGVKETIINKKTGLFFTDYSTDGLKRSIDELKSINIDPQNCYIQAKKFSERTFAEKLESLIKSHL